MHEALCRSSGTTLDSVHAEDGPPITQRTSGLGQWWLASLPSEASIPAGALDKHEVAGTKVHPRCSAIRGEAWTLPSQPRGLLPDGLRR